jgi:2-phosphosulfolactate phosphatase
MKVEVCLTPELIHQHDLAGKLVVVVDIFRATSCMVTGMAHKLGSIYPVATIEECTALGKKGMVMAGERGGKKVEHFDIGNSPYDYMDKQWSGRNIAVSTTNGTITIKKSNGADEILMGAFLNLVATVKYILRQSKDVLIHCAGWKGAPNLEDSLYAGALIEKLIPIYHLDGDSSLLAHALYQNNKDRLLNAAKDSAHAHRLSKLGIIKDIEFCMTLDQFDVVVGYDGHKLFRI